MIYRTPPCLSDISPFLLVQGTEWRGEILSFVLVLSIYIYRKYCRMQLIKVGDNIPSKNSIFIRDSKLTKRGTNG